MCEEPLFLDNEALLCNFDESQAIRVQNWLLLVNQNSPQNLDCALQCAKGINKFYQDTNNEENFERLRQTLQENSDLTCAYLSDRQAFFEEIMSQLEEKYDAKTSEQK